MTRKKNRQTENGAAQSNRPARTPEDLARYQAIRERFQREKPSLAALVSSGEYNEPLPMGEFLSIRQAVFALKKEREAAGLSLGDLAEKTGIDKAALSRIETGQNTNPTVSTLCRYAHALGKRWKWVLEDDTTSGGDESGKGSQTAGTTAGESEAPKGRTSRVGAIFPNFVGFVQAVVLPLQQAHPEYIRLDGQPTGGSREVAGRFSREGREWVVHDDSSLEPLMLAYKAALQGEEPFVVEETGGGGLCLALKSELRAQQRSRHKHLYIYSRD